MGTETIWVNGKDKIRFNDDTNTYRFVADDKDVINITMDGDNTVIVLQGHGTIRSNGDLRIILDVNQDQHPSNAKLKVLGPSAFAPDGSTLEVFSVDEVGKVTISNMAQVHRKTFEEPTGTDATLTLAPGRGGGPGRGRLEIKNQSDTDEMPQPSKAGILVLYDKLGNDYFLWVDTDGKLRLSRRDPGEHDTDWGDIVGP